MYQLEVNNIFVMWFVNENKYLFVCFSITDTREDNMLRKVVKRDFKITDMFIYVYKQWNIYCKFFRCRELITISNVIVFHAT